MGNSFTIQGVPLPQQEQEHKALRQQLFLIVTSQ
jgi:hypothetical protein